MNHLSMSDFILFFHWDMVFFLTKILSRSPSTPEIEYLHKIPVRIWAHPPTPPQESLDKAQSTLLQMARGSFSPGSLHLQFSLPVKLFACLLPWLGCSHHGELRPNITSSASPDCLILATTSKGYFLSRTITICNYLTYPCFPPGSRNLA